MPHNQKVTRSSSSTAKYNFRKLAMSKRHGQNINSRITSEWHTENPYHSNRPSLVR